MLTLPLIAFTALIAGLPDCAALPKTGATVSSCASIDVLSPGQFPHRGSYAFLTETTRDAGTVIWLQADLGQVAFVTNSGASGGIGSRLFHGSLAQCWTHADDIKDALDFGSVCYVVNSLPASIRQQFNP